MTQKTRTPGGKAYMDHRALYQEKKTTVSGVLAHIESGDVIVGGTYACEPVTLFRQLHTIAPQVYDVTVWTGITKETYLFFSDDACRSSFFINSFFYDAQARANHPGGRVSYIPAHLHQLSAEIARQKPDVFMAAVPPMDAEGYLHLSPVMQIEYEPCMAAKKRIFEINRRIPLLPGAKKVHISQVTCLIEADCEISTVGEPEPSAVERQAAENAAALVRDGDTIQIGLGNLSNAAADALCGKYDLGIHTEILCSATGRLMAKGVVNNSRKNFHPGKTVCSFVWGDQDFYDFIDRNPDIELMPSSYVNDPYIIAQNHNMVSINTAVQIDLTGQICSESLGSRQYSGTGGATDFAAGAYMSPGGRGIVVITSTAKNGTVSKIQPILSPGSVVSISRNWVDCIVTEYGVAHLRGTTIRQRVERLIAIAHPDFRGELRRQADKLMLW